jgi:hypothetical protein
MFANDPKWTRFQTTPILSPRRIAYLLPEKLMLDLMEKHPGASEASLLALFQNVARERPEVLRAIVGHL